MKKTYYLFNPGHLTRKDNTLKFTPVDELGRAKEPRYLPVEGVEEFYVFGEMIANSSLFNFLGKNDISAHFFDYYENYTGSFMPRNQLLSGKLLVNQVMHYHTPKKRMILARKLVEGAAFNMTKTLRYYDNRGKDTSLNILTIEAFIEKIPFASDVEELMGLEGNIRINYYQAFDTILNEYEMGKRSKQPPSNELNAMISFGNMMCYSQCLRAIHQTQLNPLISYLHEPGERRYSLALDLAELFKPVLVDRIIFKLLNRKEIRKANFESKLNKVLLKENGRKIFVKAFEDHLEETIKHRRLKRNVSYKYLIRLECYKLIKHLLGIEEYQPYKTYW